MKTLLCAICLLFATAALAQNAPVLSNLPQPVIMMDHPQHAAQHTMAQETTLLDTSVYTYAKGEVPLSEVGFIEYETPLGDIARAFRKEHAATATKPVKVLDNQ
jgi:hypothetical protein